MYDKYSSALPFTLGAKLPKHKAILFSGATATTGAATVRVFTDTGGASASIIINSSPYILPIQLVTVGTLPSGVTAWYLI